MKYKKILNLKECNKVKYQLKLYFSHLFPFFLSYVFMYACMHVFTPEDL